MKTTTPLASSTTAPLSTLPLLSTAQLRRVEARHAQDALMSRAGAAIADTIENMLQLKTGESSNGSIVIVCGPGNNGGDGFAAAHRLLRRGLTPYVLAPVTTGLPADASYALAEYIAAGGKCHSVPPATMPALIVDALFGSGLRRPPAAPFDQLIHWINQTRNTCNTPVLAVDLPSGLASDTGIAHTPTVHATTTLNLIALKPGVLTLDGPDHCGALQYASLDLSPAALQADTLSPKSQALDRHALNSLLSRILHRQTRNVHKGTFGNLGIVGGDAGMTGAPLLAGRAAARFGAGKVYVGFVSAPPAFDPGCLELMLHSATALMNMPHSALVIGCGLGTSDAVRLILGEALASSLPLLIDADALTLIGTHTELATALCKRAQHSEASPTILTPHPAEAARLLHCSTAEVQANRIEAACAIAREYQAHTVLKGCGSIIATPEGTWCINTTGNPALAFGGSGDVLAGILGALLAQGVGADQALRFGVCLHGAAADVLVENGQGPTGVLSEELVAAALALARAL